MQRPRSSGSVIASRVHLDHARHRPAGHGHRPDVRQRQRRRLVAPCPPGTCRPSGRCRRACCRRAGSRGRRTSCVSPMPRAPGQRGADGRGQRLVVGHPPALLVRSERRSVSRPRSGEEGGGGGHRSRRRRRRTPAAGLRAGGAADGREHRRGGAGDVELRPRPAAAGRAARRLAEPARRGDGERGGAGARRGRGSCATTAEACADLTYVFATTARDRALTKRVLTPERAMAEARAMIAAGERVGVLFGPERAGLDNADIVRANAVVVGAGEPGLRLAEPGAVRAAHRLRVDARAPTRPPRGRLRLAGGRRATRRGRPLRRRTWSSGSTRSASSSPRHKRPRMIANLDNLFRRAPLTDADVRTLHGVVRALASRCRGGSERLPGRRSRLHRGVRRRAMSKTRAASSRRWAEKRPRRRAAHRAAAAQARRGIAVWLMLLFALVVAMIVVGGMTRLTDSGLAITEWRPVTGACRRSTPPPGRPSSRTTAPRRSSRRQPRHDAGRVQADLLVGMGPPPARPADRRGLGAGVPVVPGAPPHPARLDAAAARRSACSAGCRAPSAGGWCAPA